LDDSDFELPGEAVNFAVEWMAVHRREGYDK